MIFNCTSVCHPKSVKIPDISIQILITISYLFEILWGDPTMSVVAGKELL